MKTTEADLQKAIVTYLGFKYPKLLFHHSPNGGFRNAREGAKFKAMGTRAGMPDLMIFRHTNEYAGLALELKSIKGKTTQNQDDVMHLLKLEQWRCHVINNFEQAKDIIDQYLKP
jgi:hypothetical protein